MLQPARAATARAGSIPVRFFGRDSAQVHGRLERVDRLLDSSLFRAFLQNFRTRNQTNDWPQIIHRIMELDLGGLDTIMSQVDGLPNGQVLDRADALMRQLHRDLRRGESLAPDFTLVDFIRIEISGEFDLEKMLMQSFGAAYTYVEAGRANGGVLPKHLERIVAGFERGYVMLRAIAVLSDLN